MFSWGGCFEVKETMIRAANNTQVVTKKRLYSDSALTVTSIPLSSLSHGVRLSGPVLSDHIVFAGPSILAIILAIA